MVANIYRFNCLVASPRGYYFTMCTYNRHQSIREREAEDSFRNTIRVVRYYLDAVKNTWSPLLPLPPPPPHQRICRNLIFLNITHVIVRGIRNWGFFPCEGNRGKYVPFFCSSAKVVLLNGQKGPPLSWEHADPNTRSKPRVNKEAVSAQLMPTLYARLLECPRQFQRLFGKIWDGKKNM